MPVKEGSEEYLNSEKYEIRDRKLDGPLLPMMRRLNEIRHENVALQHLSNVFWLDTGNDNLFAYAKQERGNTLIVVTNLDPAPRPGGRADDPRLARAGAGLRRRGPVHRLAFRLADRAELRRAGPATTSASSSTC